MMNENIHTKKWNKKMCEQRLSHEMKKKSLPYCFAYSLSFFFIFFTTKSENEKFTFIYFLFR